LKRPAVVPIAIYQNISFVIVVISFLAANAVLSYWGLKLTRCCIMICYPPH